MGILSYRPPEVRKGPGRPRMTEEEKEIARIQRQSNLKVQYEKRRSPRILHVVKPEEQKDGYRFKGKLLYTMKKKELIKALSYMLDVVPALCERHKEELLSLLEIK